ncbi:Glutathione amide reductase [Polystyrenella longa]|uniref:Glutathione amide reductase n=1 Tax=Polystyrenella longa TaxID=2528007 RepID=A0A518CLG2_9PLAN|nr:NAD(P)/FAD-dependent oxidoreductase [Polystyrenella longa]QDU80068.1 Glutathione amide reductase [Polystyrenella longa]
MNKNQFDVIVVGTGPAGSKIARSTAKSGSRVALIESREFGGTCALRGCNPKKVFVHAASLIDQIHRADGKLITDHGVNIDWQQLCAFKNKFTEPVAAKSERSFQDDGIETFHGTAKFSDETRICVDDLALDANRIVIATGAKPTPLTIPGEEYLIHSDEFMELDHLGDRIVFVGGGYISMEFAHVVARCGKKVTVIDHQDHVLTGFDTDLVKLLQNYSQQRGIDFRLGHRVVGIDGAGNKSKKVILEDGGLIECDMIIHGAGRDPSISTLQLDVGHVDFEDQGIIVDQYMRSTSNPIVYAAGDCAASGKPKLTPTANEEARIIADNLFNNEPETLPSYGHIPRVAFTIPAIAAVGMSQEEAKESHSEVDVRFEETSSWNSNRKTGETVAGYKLIIDKQTDLILGAHLLGPQAEETINIFALAMRYNLTATNLKATLFAFPTHAADIRKMV